MLSARALFPSLPSLAQFVMSTVSAAGVGVKDLLSLLSGVPEGESPYEYFRTMVKDSIWSPQTGYFLAQVYIFLVLHTL